MCGLRPSAYPSAPGPPRLLKSQQLSPDPGQGEAWSMAKLIGSSNLIIGQAVKPSNPTIGHELIYSLGLIKISLES